MTDYESLEKALEDWFEKPFDELPKDLQKRVDRGFRHCPGEQLTPDERRALTNIAKVERAEMRDGSYDPTIRKEQRRLWELARVKRIWDKQTPGERRARAAMWDGQHDPAIEKEQRRLWDAAKIERIAELEEKIDETERLPGETTLELDAKEKRLKKLNRKLRKATEEYDRVLGRSTDSLAKDNHSSQPNSKPKKQTRNTYLKILTMRYFEQTDGGNDFHGCRECWLKDVKVEEGGEGQIIYPGIKNPDKSRHVTIGSAQKNFIKWRKEWLSRDK